MLELQDLDRVKRKDGIAILCLLAVVLLYMRDALLMRGTFFMMDGAAQNFSIMYHVSSMLRAGHLPFWTKHLFCGYPLHAEGMGGLFYPPNLLFLIRPFHVGINLFIVLHTFLAGLFVYWFVRSLGTGAGGALLAGVAYSLSTLLNRRYGVPHVMVSLVWLPVPLALLNTWVRHRSFTWILLGGLALGVQWQACYPGISWQAHWALGLLVLFHLVGHSFRGLRAKLSLVGAAGIMVLLGLGLGAIQLLPMAELAAVTTRGQGIALESLERGGLAAQAYLTLFSPGYFGDAADASYLIHLDEVSFFYVGVIPLLLIPFAFRTGARKWGFYLVTLSLLGAYLSSIHFESATKVLLSVWPANLFRYRSHYAQHVTLAIAVLGGIGLDRLMTPPHARHEEGEIGRSNWLLICGLAACGAGLVLLLHYCRAAYFVHWEHGPLTPERPLNAAKLMSIRNLRWADLIHFAAFWGAGLLTIGLFAARLIGRRIFVPLVVGQLAVNCIFFGASPPPLIEPDFYETPPEALESLKPEKDISRLYSLFYYPLDPYDSEGLFELVDDLRISFRQKKELLAGDMNLFHGLDNAEGFAHSLRIRREKRLVNYLASSGDGRLLDLMNIKHVLCVQPIHRAMLDLVHEGRVNVYQNRSPLPRAFVVHSIIRAQDGEEAWRRLIDPGMDLAHTAVLECEADSLPRIDSGVRTKASVEFVRYDSDRVYMKVVSPGYGLLVFTDTYFPGWEATVNEKPERILRTNYNFRGVAVGPGESRVILEYRPAGVRRGAIVSSVTLAFVICAWAWLAWRRWSHSALLRCRTENRECAATPRRHGPSN